MPVSLRLYTVSRRAQGCLRSLEIHASPDIWRSFDFIGSIYIDIVLTKIFRRRSLRVNTKHGLDQRIRSIWGHQDFVAFVALYELLLGLVDMSKHVSHVE